MKRDNVIETVVQLMRLTRENKLKWERTQGSAVATAMPVGNTFSGYLNELEFELREVLNPSESAFSSVLTYRLTIKDNRTAEEIVLPYSQSVNDLGAIVASKVDNVEVLNGINERLKAL